MATLSSVLAWRIPRTEEPGRRPLMGWHRVGHDWSDLAAAVAVFHFIYCYMHHIFFVHSPVHRHLGCLHVLVTVNSAAMNRGDTYLFELLFWSFLVHTPQSVTAGSVFVVESLSGVLLLAVLWTATHQASLSFTISQSWLKLMSIELAMPSNHLIFCHPFLPLPSIFPSIRVVSNELAIPIR